MGMGWDDRPAQDGRPVPPSDALDVPYVVFNAEGEPLPPVQPQQPQGPKRRGWRRWLSSAFAALLKAKSLLLFGSLLVTMLAYGLSFGWAFGVGLVALIAIHEFGHIIAIRQRGMSASLPVFIPFMGAVIGLHQNPRDAAEEAFIGLAGPVFGLAAAFFCWWLASKTHAPVLLAIASFGMMMHIFNLIPVVPLDGGRAVAFLRWKAWGPGLIGLAVLLFYNPLRHSLVVDPFTIVILIFILYNFRSRLANPPSPTYEAIAPAAKWRYGLAWLTLMGLSIYGYLSIPLRVGI